MEEYAKRAITVNKMPAFSGGEWLIEGLEKQALGSDSGAKRGRLWCKLWSAQVPPKVERNNMVRRGKYYNTANMFERSTALLKEYKQCHLRNGSKKKRAKTKWSCPTCGRLKVNIDRSFAQEIGDGGVCVVIRDYVGECVANFARPFQYAL
ncbi:hypothetical protein ACLB2K_056423 [Fragaria x ananassa]